MNKEAKGVLIISLLIAVLIILIAGIIFYYLNSQKSESKISDTPIQKFWNATTLASLEINESVINYILYSLEANKLHNPPLSPSTPKIEVLVDQETFNAEIIKGRIVTKKGGITRKDIKIHMPRQAVINFLNSSNSISAIESSISSGDTRLEIVASYPMLFAKGYLSLYKKFTGKDLEE